MQDLCSYQLSYPEQEILELTPKECLALQKRGTVYLFYKNPSAAGKKRLTHGGGRHRVFARPGTDDKKKRCEMSVFVN